jgi:hypothetical protein
LEPRTLLRHALAGLLQVEFDHPNLDRMVADLEEVAPDWFSLYDLGPRFFAQGVMSFEDGSVFTWTFAPVRKRRRKGRVA